MTLTQVRCQQRGHEARRHVARTLAATRLQCAARRVAAGRAAQFHRLERKQHRMHSRAAITLKASAIAAAKSEGAAAADGGEKVTLGSMPVEVARYVGAVRVQARWRRKLVERSEQ